MKADAKKKKKAPLKAAKKTTVKNKRKAPEPPKVPASASPPPVALFSADTEPGVDIDVVTLAAIETELHRKRDNLIATMREAVAEIPDNLSAVQKSTLSMVRATANGDAMRALGEFSMCLHLARATRWISVDTYRDGLAFLQEISARGPRGQQRPG